MRNGVTLLVVATLGVLAAVAVVDALRSDPPPLLAAASAPSTTTAPTAPTFTALFAFGSRRGEIEDIANTWASLYAADDPQACRYMGGGLCKREPLPRFRESFDGATVQDIHFLKNYLAVASFSNGVAVEFFGDGGTWTVFEFPAVVH